MCLKSVVVCKPVNDFSDPLLNLIEATYNESFPVGERRDFTLVRDLLKDDARFVIYVLLKDDVYVGFITGWLFEGFTYAEHFAIDAAARNGGIGAEAMRQFLAFCGTPVVLEVEMPTDEMSIRRISFYERLGFVLDNHAYSQPPYRAGENWLEMRVMTNGKMDMEHSFEQVKDCIHQHVYGIRYS